VLISIHQKIHDGNEILTKLLGRVEVDEQVDKRDDVSACATKDTMNVAGARG
jgi:hypothetical protein